MSPSQPESRNGRSPAVDRRAPVSGSLPDRAQADRAAIALPIGPEGGPQSAAGD
jgi:hypothetical protein